MVTVVAQTVAKEQLTAAASKTPWVAVHVTVKVSSDSAAVSPHIVSTGRVWEDWPPVRVCWGGASLSKSVPDVAQFAPPVAVPLVKETLTPMLAPGSPVKVTLKVPVSSGTVSVAGMVTALSTWNTGDRPNRRAMALFSIAAVPPKPPSPSNGSITRTLDAPR